MPVGYHVDRSNSLEPDDTLELENELFINSDERVVVPQPMMETLRERYPEGLSRHGTRFACVHLDSNDYVSFADDTMPLIGRYQFENNETGAHRQESREPFEPIIEWVFELVRSSEFPQRPSRFQSFFGFETRQEAAEFRNRYGSDTQVVEVEYGDGFTADMEALKCPSFADGLRHATTYWQGESSTTDPTWEILMQPPVEVIDICTDLP